MLNPKHQKYVDRLQELIIEGNLIASRCAPSGFNNDHTSVQAWLSKSENIIFLVFGENSTQGRNYRALLTRFIFIQQSHEIRRVVGLLSGAKDDLENGFLAGQEFMVAPH